MLVGAYALAAHGHPRATGDLDIWIRPTLENAERVWRALARFGATIGEWVPSDFCEADMVYQLGVAPARIDLLTAIDAADFPSAWERRKTITVDGVTVPVIGRDDLLRNKRAVGRPQDLADAAWLESNS